MTARPLASLLAQRRVLILDGAIGTELERRGMDTGLPLWSARVLLDAPDVLLQIHRAHLEAGSDIIAANTWRTTPRTFRRAGLTDQSGVLTSRAVAIAHHARMFHPERTVLVAGSMGPLEDCYRPDLVPPDAELRKEHAEHARRLADAGVDLIMLETFGTVRESRIACEAALATGKEVIISFLCRGDGRLYSGEPLADAVSATAALPVAGLSINCAPARSLARLLDDLRHEVSVHRTDGLDCLAVYGNVGREGGEMDEEFVTAVSPAEYGALALSWAGHGARIIGGCCGTTREHIAAVRDALSGSPACALNGEQG
jgi:S-methylmethionine-dependent homocysteine/selenocysteine methylase